MAPPHLKDPGFLLFSSTDPCSSPEAWARCLVHGWCSNSQRDEQNECFKSPALRGHLCSLQSSHGAEAGSEADALELPHCKQSSLYSQAPSESRSDGMPFLPLALETGAAVHLPKVSSHSTSSSIVRSKSSNDGLPSGLSCQHLSITSYKYLEASFGRGSRWPRVTMVTTS